MKVIKYDYYDYGIYINDYKIHFYKDEIYDDCIFIKISYMPKKIEKLEDAKQNTFLYCKKSDFKNAREWIDFLEKIEYQYNFLIEKVLEFLTQKILEVNN